ncbi:MAG: glycerophosphodiester phosphodiesterase [Bacteroidia bacterium]|nr:glycerophosphodiester phosphodiesterase [Bacteroidia bacterium]
MNTKPHNWLTEIPIAHRGYHTNDSLIPENSLTAFENAIKNGFAIELDVHLLSDNKVVVFHDATLLRLCGIDKQISELNSDDVKKYPILESENRIPLLQNVLELVNGKVPLLIELKYNEEAGLLEQAVVNELQSYKGEFAMHSFNPSALQWFSENSPEIMRGQVISKYRGEKINPVTKFALSDDYLNNISKPDFIACDFRDLPDADVEKCRKKGLPVLAWTIRSIEEQNQISEYADNIIFENYFCSSFGSKKGKL